MARRTLVTLAAWTPRGPAPSRGSGHGAQKVYAHALHASACATAEVLVASQHAVSVPHRLAVCTDVDGRGDGSRLGRMEQRALSSCTRARRAACWPEFGGIKQRARAASTGGLGWYYVHAEGFGATLQDRGHVTGTRGLHKGAALASYSPNCTF